MRDQAFQPSQDYQNTIKVMNDIFSFWNVKYFDGRLEAPVIAVYPDRKIRAYGWFVPHEYWQEKNEFSEGSTEINICAQYLDRPLVEVAETMLHEMCHYYAYLENIQDVSRNGYYHNKRYKAIAEAHGLMIEKKDSSRGWTDTRLTERSKELFEREFVLEGNLLYNTWKPERKDTGDNDDEDDDVPDKEKKKPSSTRKYVCLRCKQTVRATKIVNIRCGRCDLQMVDEENKLMAKALLEMVQNAETVVR